MFLLFPLLYVQIGSCGDTDIGQKSITTSLENMPVKTVLCVTSRLCNTRPFSKKCFCIYIEDLPEFPSEMKEAQIGE